MTKVHERDDTVLFQVLCTRKNVEEEKKKTKTMTIIRVKVLFSNCTASSLSRIILLSRHVYWKGAFIRNIE